MTPRPLIDSKIFSLLQTMCIL